MEVEIVEMGKYREVGRTDERWFILVVGPDFVGNDPDECEEIDVLARDKKHARAVGRAALALDYEEGMEIKEAILA